jgi:hypothetical protein
MPWTGSLPSGSLSCTCLPSSGLCSVSARYQLPSRVTLPIIISPSFRFDPDATYLMFITGVEELCTGGSGLVVRRNALSPSMISPYAT